MGLAAGKTVGTQGGGKGRGETGGKPGGDRGQLPNSETYLTQTAILSTRIVGLCAPISRP